MPGARSTDEVAAALGAARAFALPVDPAAERPDGGHPRRADGGDGQRRAGRRDAPVGHPGAGGGRRHGAARRAARPRRARGRAGAPARPTTSWPPGSPRQRASASSGRFDLRTEAGKVGDLIAESIGRRAPGAHPLARREQRARPARAARASVRSMRSLAPKRYLYGSVPRRKSKVARAARGGELERVQDQQVAQPVARVGAVPARLVGGERVAPPEAVEHPDDPVVAARDHCRRPAPGPGARRQRRWKGSWSTPNEPPVAPARRAARRASRSSRSSTSPGGDPVEAHALALDPARVKRRSWRSKSFDGAPVSGPSGSATLRAGVAVERRGPPRAAPAPASPARAPRTSSGERPQRRALARPTTSSPRSSATSQAQWSPTPTPLPELAQTGTASGSAAVQPLAVAAQRDERLQAAGRVPPGGEPRARPAGRASPTTASTQSGVWKYELSSTRAASSSQSRRSPASPASRLEVRDLRLYAGSLRRASLSFPHRSKLAALTGRPARSGPARAATC